MHKKKKKKKAWKRNFAFSHFQPNPNALNKYHATRCKKLKFICETKIIFVRDKRAVAEPIFQMLKYIEIEL